MNQDRVPEDTPAQVTVIGTGIMGSAMSRNLLGRSLRTTVWDRDPAATAALERAGAQVAASAREAVAAAPVIITMLPTAEVVDAVMLADGVPEAFRPGAVWAQMGTIGVDETVRLAERIKALRPDVRFVDAPVSGSKGPAEAGELLVMASGPRDAEPLLAPVFDAIARKTVWLGDAGEGSRMKLVVNVYMSILIEGVAEALVLAKRLGVDASRLSEVIEGGPLEAPIAGTKFNKMQGADYAPEFPLKWALKDVDLALSVDGEHPPPLLEALSRQWHAAVAEGLGAKDVSAAKVALD